MAIKHEKRRKNTHNNPEIDPVLQAGGEHDRDLHGVKDRPAEIGDEFEELVFFWAGTHRRLAQTKHA
jgi:hypothetical protein